MEELSRRQKDEEYSAKCHEPPPPNAFVEPLNPKAVFPQVDKSKPINLGGLGIMRGERSGRKGKYVGRVLTTEELKEQEMNDLSNLVQEKLETTIQDNVNVFYNKDEDEELDDPMTEPKKKMKMKIKKKQIRKSKRHKLFHF